MSWQASTWVSWFSEARLGDRLIMFIIAHHASDDTGEANPSIATICRESKLARSTVIEAIYRLATTGELAIQKGGKFKGDSNRYTLPKFEVWVQNVNPKKAVGVRMGSAMGLNGVQNSRHRTIESRIVKQENPLFARFYFDEEIQSRRCKTCKVAVSDSRAALKHHVCRKVAG